MSKTLVMNFLNESGKKTAIGVNNVKEDITEAEVKAAMGEIIKRYTPFVIKIARSIHVKGYDVEDLVQMDKYQ